MNRLLAGTAHRNNRCDLLGADRHKPDLLASLLDTHHALGRIARREPCRPGVIFNRKVARWRRPRCSHLVEALANRVGSVSWVLVGHQAGVDPLPRAVLLVV